MENNRLQKLVDDASSELTNGILPFWMKHVVDKEKGGFYGEISDSLVTNRDAPKGSLLTSRILWAFSASYLRFKAQEYLKLAELAYNYLITTFWDKRDSGLFWLVDSDGKPIETRKQIYGQAFGIYALSEFYKATGEGEVLNRAVELFHLIQGKSYDQQNSGYFEAYTRDWKLETDLRLTPTDMNEKKSMNTHLHVLEAYTNLLKIWKDESLACALETLIAVFLNRIIDKKTNHLRMFFDDKWTVKSGNVSFGHDIEASWLLTETAEVLNKERLKCDISKLAVDMAQAVHDQGMDPDGGILFEADKNMEIVDSKKEWWVQCEGVVGFLSAYQLSHEAHFVNAALKTWEFIEKCIIDREHGEWVRYVTRDRIVKRNEALVNNWKCPYHNSRVCLEIINRVPSMEVVH